MPSDPLSSTEPVPNDAARFGPSPQHFDVMADMPAVLKPILEQIKNAAKQVEVFNAAAVRPHKFDNDRKLFSCGVLRGWADFFRKWLEGIHLVNPAWRLGRERKPNTRTYKTLNWPVSNKALKRRG